jgi:ribosomal protein S27E
MVKKLTYEFVNRSFSEEGYFLLSGYYVNSTTKLKYKCPEGHEHETTWSNWQQGYRCPHCSGNIKARIEDIKLLFESEGYLLLTKNYSNNKQLLSFICPNNHKGLVCLSAWYNGVRCAECYGNKQYTFDYVKGLLMLKVMFY